MIKNDRQLAVPFIQFQCPTSELASIPSPEGGMIAFVWDTAPETDGRLVKYDPTVPEWSEFGTGDVAGETHAADSKATPVDDDEIPIVDSAASWVLKKLTWANLKATLKTYFDTLYGGINDYIRNDGWQSRAETWTRTGDHTFTVSGDLTAVFRKGTKIRYRDGGSNEYGVVGSSSHSGGTTTVNLIPNTDYAMAAATITDKYISYVENPEDFPHRFNYSPTYGAEGSMTYHTVTTAAAFWVCHGINVRTQVATTAGTTGGTASAGITVSLAYTQTILANGYGRVSDGAGSNIAALITSNSNNMIVRKTDNSNFGLGTGRAFAITYWGVL